MVSVDRQTKDQRFLEACEVSVDRIKPPHSFSLIPDSPIALLGRDLLCVCNVIMSFLERKA